MDLDGTLVDQAGAARSWAIKFVDDHGIPGDLDSFVASLTERHPKNVVFAELVRTYDLPFEPGQLWQRYRTEMPHLVRCTRADRQALIALRVAGWRLGIITNGMTDNQEGKIRALGLDTLVDGWVISDEVGVRKPERRLFEALASRLGCPLEGWMIGDSLDLDIVGGAAAGLRTAWITDRFESSGYEPGLTADSVANAVEQILAVPRDEPRAQ